MADAVDITGEIKYDGDAIYVDDPVAISVTVQKPDGSALANASVTAGLVTVDNSTVEDKQTGSTNADGDVTVSLTAQNADIYQVQVDADKGSYAGKARIGYADVVGTSPLSTALTFGGLITDYTITDNAITETTLG